MDALDSREEQPTTWDEVNLLQEALMPSIRSFTRITSRAPPYVSGSPWLSYALQLEILQRESDRSWNADGRPGAPPRLAGLAAWRGGISMVGKAGFRVTEEMAEEFVHTKLKGCRHSDGLPGWHQDTIIKSTYNQFQSILLAADVRRGWEVSESITAILDEIVARNPERYLAWLSTMGYFYFTMIDHNPFALSWEEWCVWEAPKSFEVCCKQVPAGTRPPLDSGAIIGKNFRPPGDRLSITLDEAKKGNRRAMEFIDTPDGLTVFLEERAQYYMIGGVAMSREAAAQYHAIRGDDVWLSEPVDSVKESYCDSSRKREAEIEASFRC